MRKARDLLHLQFDVGVDQVVGEYAALGQEVAALVQMLQRHFEAVAHARDLGILFRRKMIEILSAGSPGWILFWMPSRAPSSSR